MGLNFLLDLGKVSVLEMFQVRPRFFPPSQHHVAFLGAKSFGGMRRWDMLYFVRDIRNGVWDKNEIYTTVIMKIMKALAILRLSCRGYGVRSWWRYKRLFIEWIPRHPTAVAKGCFIFGTFRYPTNQSMEIHASYRQYIEALPSLILSSYLDSAHIVYITGRAENR